MPMLEGDEQQGGVARREGVGAELRQRSRERGGLGVDKGAVRRHGVI
ncbi:MAG: hypothetical protein HYZ75_15860 [Elusimicrobia bacterium]|nr:hypothetical protein [Elusimicrobiota bacterium]